MNAKSTKYDLEKIYWWEWVVICGAILVAIACSAGVAYWLLPVFTS